MPLINKPRLWIYLCYISQKGCNPKQTKSQIANNKATKPKRKLQIYEKPQQFRLQKFPTPVGKGEAKLNRQVAKKQKITAQKQKLFFLFHYLLSVLNL